VSRHLSESHRATPPKPVAVATAASRASAHKLIVALLCATALSLLLALATAAVAQAGVPDAGYSTADPNLVASPDGGFDYVVVLRDANNAPLVNVNVVLDFTGAPGILLCASQDPDHDGRLIQATDVAGRAIFRVKAGGVSNGTVSVGTALDVIAYAHPRTTDFDGDQDVDAQDQAQLATLLGTAGPAGDLDRNGTVDSADAALETAHVGGSCTATPALLSSWGALKASYR
jgi:hypothetical protein